MKKRKLTEADELDWKPIDIKLPSNGVHDDWSGFVSLEEIEGVDVINDGNVLKFSKVDQTTSKKSKDKPELSKSKTVKQKKSDINLETTHISLAKWKKIGVSKTLQNSLANLSYESPTPIQTLSIPLIKQGKDVIAKASTGSGKTLAYCLPIVDKILANPNRDCITGIILAPTRELAKQIVDHIENLKLNSINVMSITGGLSQEKQERLLLKIPDIIVATPGRLWELLQVSDTLKDQLNIASGKADDSLSFLVLDEVDKLCQKGHFEDLDKIINFIATLKKDMQLLVFTATLDNDLQQNLRRKSAYFKSKQANTEESSIKKLLFRLPFRRKDTEYVDANPTTIVSSKVHEALCVCDDQQKALWLYYILLRYSGKSLIFCNTIKDVKSITSILKLLHLPVYALHAQLKQKQRHEAIEKFSSPIIKHCVLVATDVASRGLDLPFIECVIQHDVPSTVDTYVHRSGRAARGDNEGVSISIVTPKEQAQFQRLVGKLNKTQSDFRSLDIDYGVMQQLKERVNLAHKISKATSEQGKEGRDNKWMQEFAEDLGVDIEEVMENEKTKNTKVNSKELQSWRYNLEDLLNNSSQILKKGISARYLTSQETNIAQLLLSDECNPNIVGIRQESLLASLKQQK